jgi:hypothetical protein
MRIPLKHEQATPLQALMDQQAPAAQPAATDEKPAERPAAAASEPSTGGILSPTPSMDQLDGEALVSADGSSPVPVMDSTDPSLIARGVSAIRAQSGAKAADQVDLLSSHRVRTARGLTYDFSTLEALEKWLRDRDDLSGCEVASAGEEWVAAGPFLAQRDRALKETEQIIREVQAAQSSVPPGEPLSVPREQPAIRTGDIRMPRARIDLLTWLLRAAAVLASVATLAVAGATLTRYGIVDLSSVLPLSSVGIQYPGNEAAGAKPDAPEAPAAGDPERTFRKALQAARRSLRAKRFSKAALEYNRALTVHPGSVEALEGLAKAYNGLGDRDRAMAARKKAEGLKRR